MRPTRRMLLGSRAHRYACRSVDNLQSTRKSTPTHTGVVSGPDLELWGKTFFFSHLWWRRRWWVLIIILAFLFRRVVLLVNIAFRDSRLQYGSRKLGQEAGNLRNLTGFVVEGECFGSRRRIYNILGEPRQLARKPENHAYDDMKYEANPSGQYIV